MSKQSLPRIFDPLQLAKQGSEIRGEIAIAELRKVHDLLLGKQGYVQLW